MPRSKTGQWIDANGYVVKEQVYDSLTDKYYLGNPLIEEIIAQNVKVPANTVYYLPETFDVSEIPKFSFGVRADDVHAHKIYVAYRTEADGYLGGFFAIESNADTSLSNSLHETRAPKIRIRIDNGSELERTYTVFLYRKLK